MDLKSPVTNHDHRQGPDDAPITLVEYGDFQCPDAGRLQPVLQVVLEHFGAQIRYVYRHFPLPIHDRAIDAAEAAEAAGAQGKFFEMAHHLYQHQHDLSPSRFSTFAGLLALDKEKFMGEVNNHVYRDRVRRDYESGRESGVHATPTLFINGEKYDGPSEKSSLIAAIDAKMPAAQAP